MLDPHERVSLFDALRPPPGYQFDAAVGTSFTLDLEALLSAPVAFTLFEEEDTPADDGEPVGLLEAIRRHASRITLFCQAGQIAVPRRHRSVFAWLEGAVAPVRAPRPRHLFHPKVWVVRFFETGGERFVLRLLCATRNLTFDTSWDTLLRLESEPYRKVPSRELVRQAPVATFLRRLPELTTVPLDGQRTADVESLANAISSVPLAVPEGFEGLRFHILGLSDLPSNPLPSSWPEAAVVAPFLSARFLEDFASKYDVRLLVSREESLDRIPAGVLSKIDRLAVLNPAVDLSVAESTQGENGGRPDEAVDPAIPLSGLHAKLFVFSDTQKCRVLTGSANASEAAFDGNIEVVAELTSSSDAPLESLLARSPGEPGVADLLIDYEPPETATEEDEQEQLEISLDELRRQIAALRFVASVTQAGEQFTLKLISEKPIPSMEADELQLAMWPVTLAEDQSSREVRVSQRAEVPFEVALDGITAFFGFRATARKGSAGATTAFTIVAVLEGAPEDRQSRLLAAMLRDPNRLLRFLLLLLSDAPTLTGNGARGVEGWFGRWRLDLPEDLPLMELLVRAVERYPDRLDHIDALLRDLADSQDEIMPPGFREIWEPIWAGRMRIK